MKLRIFTDGACSGNPGPGGWAAVFNFSKDNKEVSGYETETTNNRMELKAVVCALNAAKGIMNDYDSIEIHSDSAYVVNAVAKGWLRRWRLSNWKKSDKEDVKNKDLWSQLYELLKAGTQEECEIIFVKVKGHAGNMFNERADELAKEQSMKAKEIISNKTKQGGASND